MPYIIDSITAQTIDVNGRLTLDGQEIITPKYYNVGNSSENTNIDWSDGLIQEINLDNNPTLTFSNGLLGQLTTLLLKQQTEGLKTITWPNNVIWNGGNEPTMQSITAITAGNIDTTFDVGIGFDGGISSNMIIQPDGKIVVGGGFTSYDGTESYFIIRLNSDGSVDSTFNVGSGFNNVVNSMALQPDGKILVSGSFTSYNEVGSNYLIRLNPDGSIDNTFDIGTGLNNRAWGIALQPDGKIILVGTFTTYNESSFNHIIRLNSDGSVDNTFDIGTGFGSEAFRAIIQPDGKIIVSGFFTTYKGVGVNRIIRLNSDGSVDNTFSSGSGFNNYAEPIALQPDGKIIVGGFFTSYNGVSSNYIIRLNSDGSVDNTFDIGNGFNGYTQAIEIQPDGKILVGGDFTYYNETSPINRIIRLNSDGSIDTTFEVAGFDSYPYSIVTQSDGNIVIGGNFTSYGPVLSNFIIRLIGEPLVDGVFYNLTNFTYNGTYYIGSY